MKTKRLMTTACALAATLLSLATATATHAAPKDRIFRKGPIIRLPDGYQSPVQRLTPVPLVTDALAYLNRNRGGGREPAIFATVTISSATDSGIAHRSVMTYAQGRLFVTGSGKGKRLEGDVTEYRNYNRHKAADPFNKATVPTRLHLIVRQYGNVSLQTITSSTGKVVNTESFNSDGGSGLLYGRTKNYGVTRLMTVALLKSTVRVANSTPPPATPPAAPRGIELNVRAFFTITNSDDGLADHVVEAYGEVLFNNWTMWYILREDAADERKNSSINTHDLTFNVMFDDPKTAKMALSGFLSDRDKGVLNNDDAMWNPSKERRIIDIRKIYEDGGQGGRNGVYVWNGDRNSESADLTLVISKVGDIY